MKKLWLILGLMVLTFSAFVAPAALADGPSEARIGRAEMRFMQGMIDHHQMALDMANDCLAKAVTERVRTLCQNVIDAQSAEIAQMQSWLQTWYSIDYVPMSMMDMMDMMGMMGGDRMPGGMMMDNMPGMDHSMMGSMMIDPPMMMGMMAGLSQLEGVEYEIAWLESMIDHHDDAINMSERLLLRLGESGHTELREMAQNIIDAQTTEIESMEQLIAELSA